MHFLRNFCVLGALLVSCGQPPATTEWPAYAGSVDGNRYSPLTQLNPGNVTQLVQAWAYSSGDRDTANRSQNQCNPIMRDGILYATTPRLQLVALEAHTGKLIWKFDPMEFDSAAKENPYAYYKVSRGMMFWSANGQERIFYGTGDKLWSVVVPTGRPDSTFGERGWIDLTRNLDRDVPGQQPFVALTTPGVIYQDLIILGHRVAESADGAPGYIRAFDTRTGALRWTFHTVPRKGEPGAETWPKEDPGLHYGGANSWAGMALDEATGVVYVPTGSPAGDFYGGNRQGKNLYGNSLLALQASTGKLLWHYQVVHHDLWDRDLAANPNLVTLNVAGKKVAAVAQITKHGYVFVFDRTSGEPLFPIDEVPVPPSELTGEVAWATQPVPRLPVPFARQTFPPEEVSQLDTSLTRRYQEISTDRLFAPPSTQGTWMIPGFDGGGEWGGAAVDPESGILYVNSSELPWSMVMEPMKPASPGEREYLRYCASCHKADKSGNPPSYPALLNLKQKYNREQLLKIIQAGKNMMPAFPQLTAAERKHLVNWLLENSTATQENDTEVAQEEIPYRMTGYHRFLDAKGYPGITPPWGTLNAIDLNTGSRVWRVPLGEYPELTAKGIPKTGTENYGGPVVTKGGLIFIAATKDERIQAFDKKTGVELWSAKLPAAGYATPAVYEVGGKEFLVIVCGGGKIGSPSGDSIVAFSLP